MKPRDNQQLSQQFIQQKDIIPIFGFISTIVLFGLLSILYGFLPFSPAFCVEHIELAVGLYLILIGSLWSFELRVTENSPRPLQSSDDHLYFWGYLSLLLIFGGVTLPFLWLEMGQSLSSGYSIDEVISQSAKLWCFTLATGGLCIHLRSKAIEEKDISRVNRCSPPLDPASSPLVIAQEWSHSDVWDAIPITDDELALVSEVSKASYRQRRYRKLSRETHPSIPLFEGGATSQSGQLAGVPSSPLSKLCLSASSARDDSDSDLNATSLRGEEPRETNLGFSSASSSTSRQYRRSTDDFDTRFELEVPRFTDILSGRASWTSRSEHGLPPLSYPSYTDSPIPQATTRIQQAPLQRADEEILDSELTDPQSIEEQKTLPPEKPTQSPQDTLIMSEPEKMKAFGINQEDLTLWEEANRIVSGIDHTGLTPPLRPTVRMNAENDQEERSDVDHQPTALYVSPTE